MTLVGHPQAQAQATGPTFAAAQADAGKTAYTTLCAGCHGGNLEGGGEAPSLNDDRFRTRWGGSAALDLIATIRRMPPGTQPRSAGDNTAILAYLLRESRLGSAGAATPSNDEQLASLRLPGGATALAGRRARPAAADAAAAVAAAAAGAAATSPR